MALETKAWVIPRQGAPAELQTITLPALSASQVQVDIVMNGLCHTDIHMRDNDWGISDYPLVVGHEGIGVVTVVGDCVRTHSVGDLVGITWIRDSCNDCKACDVGRENICEKGYQGTFLSSSAGCWGSEPFNAHGGCFSKTMRIEAKFALKLPKNLPMEAACPLMCGGGTVYEPLRDYVKTGDTVGIIGIGGLGVAAIKLAKLSGANVIALSRTQSKAAPVAKLGATFVNTTSEAEMKAVAGSMDLIIDCTPANLDVAPYMGLLKFNGTLCRVGIPSASDMDFKYSWIPLIFCQKKIVGSIVTGSARTKDMLSLAAANIDYMQSDDANYTVQKMPFEQCNEAMEQLQKQSQAGFRILLVNEDVLARVQNA